MGPMLDSRAPGNFSDVLKLDPEAWTIRIAARWRMGVESIIATGRLILDAKAALPHGQFGTMIREQLPFGERQAQMLMAIASHPRMSNPQYVSLLPPTLGTIYDATRLSDDEWAMGVEKRIIRPDMERADLEQLRPRALRGPSSDGGGEATSGTPERPAGTGDRLAEPLAAVTPATEQPSQQPRPEAVEEGRKDAGVAPGPSEAVLPGGGLAIAHSRVEPADSLDFFPTPTFATRALFERVLKHLNRLGHCQFQKARDPCCGNGLMSEVMAEYFQSVIASDIGDYDYEYEKANFLEKTPLDDEAVDWFVMNSPFGSAAEDFCLKSIELAGVGVAMLVRLQWLETPGRYERIYKNNPPSLIAIFTERVPIHKGRWVFNGKTMTAYVWLLWIKGMEPQPPFWIPPGCREALTKPGDAERFGAVWEDDEGSIYPTFEAFLAATRNEAPAAEAAE